MDLNIFKEQTQQEILSQAQKIAAYTELIAKGQTVDSFAGLQTLVRNGVVGTAVKVGDQLVAAWDGTNRDWDVQGIDEACPVDPTKTHTLDILAHPVLAFVPFDQSQYLYAVTAEAWPDGMPAGTYNFGYRTSASAITYWKFTTTKVVPVGGGIRVSAAPSASAKVITYAADTFTELESDLALSEASDAADGTPLGVTSDNTRSYIEGDAMNFVHRCQYGANRWRYSFMRQYLNSDEATMTWTPGTIWSRRPSTLPAGFLYTLDPALKSVLGRVRVRYAIPNCDGGGYEDLEDLVTLQTMLDMGYGNNGNVVEGPVDAEGNVKRTTAYSLWRDAEQADKIKYAASAASIWWLSSTLPGHSYIERVVTQLGELSYNGAGTSNGGVPSLHII